MEPHRSFEDFFEREYPNLVRALIPLAPSIDAAEEAAQDSMRRVFERWRRVAGMDSPVGYAYVIGRNSLRSRLRRATRFVLGERDVEVIDKKADPARTVAARDRVLKALARISPSERDALLLVAYLGLDTDEAARVLGSSPPPSAVESTEPGSPSATSSRRKNVTRNANDIDNWLRSGLDDFSMQEVDPRLFVADPAPRRRRRRLGGLAVAAAGAAAAIVLAVALAPSGEPVGPPSVQASVRLTMPGTVLDSAGEGETLWVLTCDGSCGDPTDPAGDHGDLVKVDNETGAIEATTPIENPHSLAVGEGGVWVVQATADTVSRYSPDSGGLVATVRLSLPTPIAEGPEGSRFLPFAAAVGDGSLWVGTDRGYVAEVDLRSDEVVRTIKTSAPADDLAVAGESVAIAANLDGVVRIDAATGTVSEPEPIEDDSGRRLSVSELVTAEGSFWAEGAWSKASEDGGYVITDENGVVEFDPATGRVENVSTVSEGLTVRAVEGQRLWLADTPSREVYELDGSRPKARLVARLKSRGTIIGSVGSALWVVEPHRTVAQFRVPSGD